MAGRGLDFWRKPGTVLRGPGSQDSREERVADLSGESVSPWFPVSPLQSPWPPESLPLLSWASISVTQPRRPTSSCGACPAREGVGWAGKGGGHRNLQLEVVLLHGLLGLEASPGPRGVPHAPAASKPCPQTDGRQERRRWPHLLSLCLLPPSPAPKHDSSTSLFSHLLGS